MSEKTQLPNTTPIPHKPVIESTSMDRPKAVQEIEGMIQKLRLEIREKNREINRLKKLKNKRFLQEFFASWNNKIQSW